MTQTKVLGIRFEEEDLNKLNEIRKALTEMSFHERAVLRRRYYKYTHTLQDAIIFLIRSYHLQINVNKDEPTVPANVNNSDRKC